MGLCFRRFGLGCGFKPLHAVSFSSRIWASFHACCNTDLCVLQHAILVSKHIPCLEGEFMLCLLSGDRLMHAKNRADDALVNGERMTKKLVDSLDRLRTLRDQLALRLVQATEKEEGPFLEKED